MDKIEKVKKKKCVRTFRLGISASEDQSVLIMIPGVVKKIKLKYFGIHKVSSQNVYDIDFGGLFPDGVKISTHTALDNTFLNYYDLEFDYNGRIDGQYRISARLITDGTPLPTGNIIFGLEFTYE